MTITQGRGLGSPELYGHTFRGREATPLVRYAWAGGGVVPIPHLAAEAEATGKGSAAWEAIERQAESAARMQLIDELISQMLEQARS